MSDGSTVMERVRVACPAVSVGMLTADLLSLGDEIRILENSGVNLVHFDVMDGCFCPMMTAGPPLIKAVKTSMLKDVHLMVQEPLEKIGAYVAAGADIITFHVESCKYPHRVLQELSEMTNVNDASAGIGRGIAVNPGTSLTEIEPLLDMVDIIFLLAINPGWGGQSFDRSTEKRIAEVLEMIRKHKTDIVLGVDGGIKKDNIRSVVEMGADIIVTGSAVFDGGDVDGNARFMLKEAASRH